MVDGPSSKGNGPVGLKGAGQCELWDERSKEVVSSFYRPHHALNRNVQYYPSKTPYGVTSFESKST